LNYKYDLFISYASEDKDFVQPLAEALRGQRLAVWFDQFELRPGVGLRESIDRGLLSSRFGLVVLSPSFFGKSWPRWELDGLVQLALSRADAAILPVWHGVGHEEVSRYSPSLANIVAIPSHDDPKRVVSEVLRTLRPRPTAVEVARELLVGFDFPAPVMSDDWWLDAAAWSAPEHGEGTFQENSSWGWWGFPLPAMGDSPESKGERIAWAAMQHSWQEAARELRVTQCTHPDQVLDFVLNQPGLAATAEEYLDFLLCYVPQLGIPGMAGFLEPLIDEVFSESEKAIRARPGGGAPGWVLHAHDYCSMSPGDLWWRYFWPTDPAGTSPDASVLNWVDAAAWIWSTASDWLPEVLRATLREGLADKYVVHMIHYWRLDLWDMTKPAQWAEVMYHGPREWTSSRFVREAQRVLAERIEGTRELLGLPEESTELAAAIASSGALAAYLRQLRPKASKSGSRGRKGAVSIKRVQSDGEAAADALER
jgi:hypothetical protein